MVAYRVYLLDGTGRIERAEWLEADGDAQAIIATRGAAGDRPFEVWEKRRLVARFPDEPPATEF
jgi:hypothetical protein